MTSQLSHHDGFFKKFLGDLSVARDFLAIHLPEH
ncbi:TpnA protein, partial [Arsenophonus sp. ENCA]